MTETRSGRVLLMGMMGVGKSSVGRAFAELSGWRYVDNDELVEIATGIDARHVLNNSGEDALRKAESAALRAGLELDPPLVASIAAGVVDVAEDRAALQSTDAFVVWLHAPIAVLAKRVVNTGRPWLDEDPERILQELYDGREERYAEVADLLIDTDRCSPAEAAEQILAAVRP